MPSPTNGPGGPIDDSQAPKPSGPPIPRIAQLIELELGLDTVLALAHQLIKVLIDMEVTRGKRARRPRRPRTRPLAGPS